MWDELRGNLGTRRILVLVLAAPIAVFGILLAIFLAAISAAPWLFLLDESGYMSSFVTVYSIATIFAIAAPRFKFTVAAVIVIAAVTLSYPWPWQAAKTDFDDTTSPYSVWAGVIAGGFLAVLLVGLHFRSRWLLVLPAYFVGILVALFGAGIFAATVGALLSPWQVDWPVKALVGILPVGGAGGVVFASLVAPTHRRKIIWATIVVSVFLIGGSYWFGIGASSD